MAFEPNPELAATLQERFPTVTIHEVALSDTPGRSEFHLLTQLPAQSGLLRRPTDRPSDEQVIDVRRGDDRPPAAGHRRIDLIKIDVEGAEVNVLRGARRTLRRWQPVVVFEHGVRTSKPYGTTPEMLFDLLAGVGLNVFAARSLARRRARPSHGRSSSARSTTSAVTGCSSRRLTLCSATCTMFAEAARTGSMAIAARRRWRHIAACTDCRRRAVEEEATPDLAAQQREAHRGEVVCSICDIQVPSVSPTTSRSIPWRRKSGSALWR